MEKSFVNLINIINRKGAAGEQREESSFPPQVRNQAGISVLPNPIKHFTECSMSSHKEKGK